MITTVCGQIIASVGTMITKAYQLWSHSCCTCFRTGYLNIRFFYLFIFYLLVTCSVLLCLHLTLFIRPNLVTQSSLSHQEYVHPAGVLPRAHTSESSQDDLTKESLFLASTATASPSYSSQTSRNTFWWLLLALAVDVFAVVSVFALSVCVLV